LTPPDGDAGEEWSTTFEIPIGRTGSAKAGLRELVDRAETTARPPGSTAFARADSSATGNHRPAATRP